MPRPRWRGIVPRAISSRGASNAICRAWNASSRFIRDTLEPDISSAGGILGQSGNACAERLCGTSDEIDSPLLTAAEREAYKALLRRLGDCSWLSIRIYLAEMGLNPLFRFIAVAKIRTKDLVKNCLRLVKR